MEKKGRVYILDGSYPESVDIVSVKFGVNEHLEVGSAEEFWDNIGHWLALSKSPDYDVVMIVRASKCGLLWFEHGTVTSTEGRIKLKEVTDIEYYTMNPDTHEWIFGDKIKEYLDQPNDLIKRALVDESVFDINEFRTTAKNNMDMATAGKTLMQSVLSEYMLDYYNYPQVPLAYFMEHILTDEKIANIIAPKYNLDKLITTGKITKKSTQKILTDCVYSIIWAIYETTRNIQDIKQIVRGMVDDTEGNHVEYNRQNYKKIGEYIKQLSTMRGDEITEIDFGTIQKETGVVIDYKMLGCTDMLRDFGYKITYVDLDKQVFHLEISYW